MVDWFHFPPLQASTRNLDEGYTDNDFQGNYTKT